MKIYYISRAQHAKAIAYHMRIYETNTYPLCVRNGMTNEVVRDLERKKPVSGLRIYFTRHNGYTSPLRFERTY